MELLPSIPLFTDVEFHSMPHSDGSSMLKRKRRQMVALLHASPLETLSLSGPLFLSLSREGIG